MDIHEGQKKVSGSPGARVQDSSVCVGGWNWTQDLWKSSIHTSLPSSFPKCALRMDGGDRVDGRLYPINALYALKLYTGNNLSDQLCALLK